MITVLQELFSSKKFITALVGVLISMGAHFGLHLDPELTAAIIGLFAFAIGAQGLADHGKEAARIAAGSPPIAANQVVVTTERREAGIATFNVLLLLGALATVSVVAGMMACKNGSFPTGPLIDCATQDVGKTLPEIGETLVADVVLIASSDDPATAFANLILQYGNDAVACAMRAAADVLLAHPPHIQAPPPSPEAKAIQKFMAEKGWRFK